MHVDLVALFSLNFSDHCLVMWSDEDSVSVVPISKIISPPSSEIKAGCSCKVKGFEACPSWVVSVGTKDEVEVLEEFIHKPEGATPVAKRE